MDKHPKVRDDVEDLDDEITDEVVPSSPRLERVKKKSFYPWHKPRKQYVRNIWKNNVKSLLRKIKRPEENNVFRYFTLPGADMLDIRHLEEVVRGEGFKLKYLGFDSTGKKGEFSDEFELSLSQNAVRSDTEWVERSSTMIWDSLETLVSDGNKDSVNLVKVKSHAPFDAINIDLCKSIAYSKGNESSVFDALVKLIEVQVHKSSNQWLLFITTKIEKEEVSQRHLSAFLRAVEDNCNTSKMFKDHFEQFVVRREVDSNSIKWCVTFHLN